QYLLKDSGVQLVLTQEKWIGKLSNLLWYGRDQSLLALDADWPVLDLSALRKQPALLARGQPAFVLYASGSARKPRGVITEHAALLNRLRWTQDVFPLSADDKVLHKNPFPSDAAIWEMLWPLTAGARLFIAPSWGREDARQLAEIIEQFGITT